MRFHQFMSLVALVLCMFVEHVRGRRNGVPECVDLPGHGTASAPLNTAFYVSANATEISPGETIEITMTATSNAFKGFHLWVNHETISTKVGMFTVQDDLAKLSPCPGAQGVTHTNNEAKTSVTVLWSLPETAVYAASYTIKAAMVQDQNNYWIPSTVISRKVVAQPPDLPGPPVLVTADDESLTLNVGAIKYPNIGSVITGVTVWASGVAVATCTDMSLVVNALGTGYEPNNCVIESLSSNSKFAIHIVATNAAGTSGAGVSATFKTLPTNPTKPPPVDTPLVTVTGPRTLNVTWEHPALVATSAYITEYSVSYRYYAETGYVSNWRVESLVAPSLQVTPPEADAPALPDSQISLKGLAPGFTYDVRVTVSSLLGDSDSSPIVQVTTDKLAGSDRVCKKECELNGGSCVRGECFCGDEGGIAESLGENCETPAAVRCFEEPARFCFSWIFYFDTKANGRVMEVSIHGATKGWVGVMYDASDNRMQDADTIVGWVDDVTGETFVEDRYSSATGVFPDLDTEIGGSNDIYGIRGTQNSEKGTTTIQYRRLVSNANDIQHDFEVDPANPTIPLSWALGADDSFGPHESNGKSRGSGLVDMSAEATGLEKVTSLGGLRGNMIMAHIIGMVLAFAVLFPSGVLVAVQARSAGVMRQVRETNQIVVSRESERNSDSQQDEKDELDHDVPNIVKTTGYFKMFPSLFQTHRALQSFGGLLAIGGVIAILAAPDRGIFSNPLSVSSSHSGLGLVMAALLVGQMVAGYAFHGNTSHTFHRWNGMLLMVLGFTRQLPTGLALTDFFPASWNASVNIPMISSLVFLVGYLIVSWPRFKAALRLHTGTVSWPKMISGFDSWLERSFYRLGVFVSRSPKKVMAIGAFSCFVCAIGVLQMVRLSKSRDLYVPQSARALQELDILETEFPQFVVDQIDLQLSVKQGENILTKENLILLLGIQYRIESLHEPVSNTTFQDLCYYSWSASGCTVYSVLQLWGTNKISIENDADIMETVSVDEVIWPPLNEVPIEDLVGGIVRDPNTNKVVRAESLRVKYYLSGEGADDMQRLAIEIVLEAEAYLSEFGLGGYVYSSVSSSDELNKAISGDIVLFVLAVVTMVLFSVATLGEADVVRGKTAVALGGVVSVILSIAAGFGLSMFFGFPFTSIHLVLPYIIIGIGLDDMYIIVGEMRNEAIREASGGNAWSLPSEVEMSLRPDQRAATAIERRIARGLSFAGASVWMTSITDVIAFSMGLASLMPAVQSFCFYAAWCVAIDFVMQVTFFMGIVVLDARREKSHNADCCCCFSVSSGQLDDDDSQVLKGGGEGDGMQPKKLAMDRSPKSANLLRKYLLSNTSKAVVVILWFVLAGSFGYFATQITAFQDEWQVFTDDSRALQWRDNDVKYFSDVGDENYFLMLFDVDYSEVNQARTFKATDNFVEALELTSEPFSWLLRFRDWAANDTDNSVIDFEYEGKTYQVIPPDKFYSLLKEFLELPYIGDVTKRFINFNCLDNGNTSALIAKPEAGCVIGSSAITFPAPIVSDSDRTIEIMLALRKVCDDSQFGEGQCVTFAGDSVNGTLYASLIREVIVCVGGALLAIAVVSQISMVNPRLGVLTTISVGVIDLQVLGLMYVAGLTLNAVTLVVLIMSIGISFDHVGHIVHAYMHSMRKVELSRDDCVIEALLDVGPSVFRSAFSTFLGVCYLGLAGADIFRTMFLGFMFVVVTASVHCFVFVPVILSLLGPISESGDTHSTTRTSSTGEEVGLAANLESKGRVGCNVFRVIVAMMACAIFVMLAAGVLDKPRSIGNGVTTLSVSNETEFNVTFNFDKYLVPEVRTTYACMGFDLPLVDSMYHFTGFTMNIDRADVVHHTVLFACTEPFPRTVTECGTMPSSCQTTVATWALSGTLRYDLPDDIGVELGRGTPYNTFVVQMHYDNYKQEANVIDSSGMTMHLSKQYRPKTAGNVFFGATSHIEPMPPGLSAVTRYTHCPLIATERAPTEKLRFMEELMGDELEYVTIFRVFLHMHELGKKISVVLVDPDGNIREELLTDLAYNFEVQEQILIPETRMYKNDTVMVRCEYDTTSKSGFTIGGDATEDEMCVALIDFYPRPKAMDEDVSLSACIGDTEGFEVPQSVMNLW